MLFLCIIVSSLIGVSLLGGEYRFFGWILLIPSLIVLFVICFPIALILSMLFPIFIIKTMGKSFYTEEQKKIVKEKVSAFLNKINGKKLKIIICSFLLISSSVFLFLFSQNEQEKIFQQAVDFVANGNYEQALKILKKLPDNNPEYTKLERYAYARAIYDPDDIEKIKKAQRALKEGYISIFGHDIIEFERELEEQYKICKRKEFQGKIPYVGMADEDVVYTDWGKPFEITEEKKWSVYFTYYKFNVNGKIYEVCVSYKPSESPSDGKVLNIYPDPKTY